MSRIHKDSFQKAGHDIRTAGEGHIPQLKSSGRSVGHAASLKDAPSRRLPRRCTNVTSRGLLRLSLLQLASLPRARHQENLTLAKHILHLSTTHWVTPSGARGGRKRASVRSVLPGAAPTSPTHTDPTHEAKFSAAAENPIKSNAISNLPHHGKTHRHQATQNL